MEVDALRSVRLTSLFLPALLLCVSAAHADKGLKPGTLAPRFTLKTIDGKKTVESRELFKAAPATVLILWDSYCPDCLATVKACQRFTDNVKDRGIQVVGVNYDREKLASVRGFLKAGKIKFPNLHDRTGDTIKAYRAQAYDFSYFVIDHKGIVRFAAYDHPPEIEKELERAVNEGLGEESPLLEKEETEKK
jgi:peroxiredoxin